MKNTALAISLITLATGCATRRVEKSQERVKLFETSQIRRTAPGDRVYIEMPRTPNERPRSTTKTYRGARGAVSDVVFDSVGQVSAIRTDCPEIDEHEQRNTELEYELRTKNSERSMNVELAKTAKSTFIWLAIIFATAWVLRGLTANVFGKK